MQLVQVHEDFLTNYVHKEILVVAGSKTLVDSATSQTETRQSIVFKGHVLRLFIQESRVRVEVGLNGMVQASFEEAMHNLMAWQRRIGRMTYFLSLNAAVDDSGNLSFAPNLGGACAYIRRT